MSLETKPVSETTPPAASETTVGQVTTRRFDAATMPAGTIISSPVSSPGSRPMPAQAVPVTGTKSGRPTIAVYLAADLLAVGVSLAIAQFALQFVNVVAAGISPLEMRLAGFFAAAAIYVSWYQGLYSSLIFHPAAELRRIGFAALGIGMFFLTLQFAVLNDRPGVCFTAIAAAVIFAPAQTLLRAACRLMFGRSRWWGRRVLLVGGGDRSQAFYRRLQKMSLFGLRPIGYMEDFDALGDDTDKSAYLGPLVELSDRAEEYGVNVGLVLTSATLPRPELARLTYRANTGIKQWLIVPDDIAFPSLWASARDVAGLPTVGISNHLYSPFRRFVKRMFDLAIVAALSPLLAPLIALLVLAVKFNSPGKVFYSQERIGRNGRRFRAWKVRSMVENADAVLKQHLESDPALMEEWNRDHKLKNDPRVTWIGKILRKTSLDELPQVWNVLRGEMSLVGPRPIVEKEIEKYGDVYEQYLMVTPGITGIWQISGRNNTTYEERVGYDSYYVKNWSLWLDLYILISTVKVVLLREGAY